MPFALPQYRPPDFAQPQFSQAPCVTFRKVTQPGVLPENYHATTIYPEYFQLRPGEWRLLAESRMDCAVVREAAGELRSIEPRHLKVGDLVACGRHENGEDGILVYPDGFAAGEPPSGKFVFRNRITRESSFSIDYDELYDLLRFERQHGFILWVLGAAVVFDRDTRLGLVRLIENGYVHGLLAGNGLAVHDLEGALYGTALGQEIYHKQSPPLGHYNHLDTINRIRAVGSIDKAVSKGLVKEGIIQALVQRSIPYVLAGSIRDDGPLPEVVADVYEAQDRMRGLARRATTVVALASQLHAIATGNMVPSYRVTEAGQVRPVYFYTVDMSEFVVTKLANRGSLTARSILTNVQDFVVTLTRGLQERGG